MLQKEAKNDSVQKMCPQIRLLDQAGNQLQLADAEQRERPGSLHQGLVRKLHDVRFLGGLLMIPQDLEILIEDLYEAIEDFVEEASE